MRFGGGSEGGGEPDTKRRKIDGLALIHAVTALRKQTGGESARHQNKGVAKPPQDEAGSAEMKDGEAEEEAEAETASGDSSSSSSSSSSEDEASDEE